MVGYRLPITMPKVENEVGFTMAQYPGLDRDVDGGPHATCQSSKLAAAPALILLLQLLLQLQLQLQLLPLPLLPPPPAVLLPQLQLACAALAPPPPISLTSQAAALKDSEKLLVGYRWYLANPTIRPAFAFGHGLSVRRHCPPSSSTLGGTPLGCFLLWI